MLQMSVNISGVHSTSQSVL